MGTGARIKRSIQGAHIGNYRILDQLEDHLADRLFGYVKWRLSNYQEAEDLLYGSFEKVVTMASKKEIKDVTRYIYKVVQNNFKNRNKKLNHHTRYLEKSKTPGYLEVRINERLATEFTVLKRIDNLPKRAREVIKYYLQGYNAAEIALMMKITPETVRCHKNKAIKVLQKQLGIAKPKS